MGHVVRFGVSLDAGLLRKFDAHNRRKGYDNRSEAIRDLVRENLVADEWATGTGEAVGVVSLVFTHDRLELSKNLTRAQHRHHGLIVSATHIHLDEHNCLEVVILRGAADEVRHLAEELITRRGVKHGKLVMTTTGRRLP